ncbi:MAG: GNAT family N-acetyltransferase [Thermoanaerobaculia bacterium]
MTLLPTIADADVIRLQQTDLPRLSRLCADCTAFFELIEGQSGGEATAADILGPLAPEHARGTKHVFGLQRDDELIGVAELLDGYPSAQEWFIGLLLLHPEHRRGGLGARVCAALLDWIRVRGGVAVRLVVQHQSPLARVFWERQGFSVEREAVSHVGRLDNPVWILLRQLGDGHAEGR